MLVEAVTIEGIRTEFPAFRIWKEAIGDRSTYVARSRQWGRNPHTVVTPDLAELRDTLASAGPVTTPAASADSAGLPLKRSLPAVQGGEAAPALSAPADPARQSELDKLGKLWEGRFDIFHSHGLFWARSTTDSVRLAADSAEGLAALLAKIA